MIPELHLPGVMTTVQSEGNTAILCGTQSGFTLIMLATNFPLPDQLLRADND